MRLQWAATTVAHAGSRHINRQRVHRELPSPIQPVGLNLKGHLVCTPAKPPRVVHDAG